MTRATQSWQGFDEGLETVWAGAEGMHKIIKTLYEEEGKSRKLYITGHSLGGALATVAAARLAFLDDINIAGMYTIGSPRYSNSNPSLAIPPACAGRIYRPCTGNRYYSAYWLFPFVLSDFTGTRELLEYEICSPQEVSSWFVITALSTQIFSF